LIEFLKKKSPFKIQFIDNGTHFKMESYCSFINKIEILETEILIEVKILNKLKKEGKKWKIFNEVKNCKIYFEPFQDIEKIKNTLKNDEILGKHFGAKVSKAQLMTFKGQNSFVL
jgi:hypothetical protein